ncbi:hypothetical protein SCANM63S_06531 [Streptomyces canarius]
MDACAWVVHGARAGRVGTVGRARVLGMPASKADAGWIAKGLLVGSPQQVIDGIMAHREVLGADRFVGQLDPGLPEDLADGSLELCLTEVLPVIETETRAPGIARRRPSHDEDPRPAPHHPLCRRRTSVSPSARVTAGRAAPPPPPGPVPVAPAEGGLAGRSRARSTARTWAAGYVAA